MPAPRASLDPSRGAAAYTPWSLRLYDTFVLGFSGRFVWRCPKARVLAMYDELAAARHLDIGVGTGYFLDRCRFPVADPAIELLDLNPSSLAHTAARIRRYHPVVHQANVLDWAPADVAPFGSVATSFLLHCLPGDMDAKAPAFERIRAVLAPGGVFFGATILGAHVRANPLARALLRLYNARGIMSNRGDSAAALEAALRRSFPRVAVDVVGCVALFVCRGA